eukprot:TRINITY_DN178_c0_g1_i1.p1 TRINITY_DN178_c0_g1~~TRINITY_DN178_c0_g1_i1.p1  ORF type:complete len:247 (-),score=45.23 TRINITY_DN178_c0_g1_i1:121-861(-)
MEKVIQEAENFVKKSLIEDGMDSSHDYWHIHRVRNMALMLAEKEGLSEGDKQIVELAALLHDVKDWKYSKDMNGTVNAAKEFLNQHKSLISEEICSQVLDILQRIGFKDELKRKQQEEENKIEGNSDSENKHSNKKIKMEQKVFGCVQDADRLDAIGAIGIARCLTFGGRFGTVLYDPEIKPRENLSKEQYTDLKCKQTSVNHFYEKLLKLKFMMKTESGREIAEERHRFMEDFLERFYAEWDGKK